MLRAKRMQDVIFTLKLSFSSLLLSLFTYGNECNTINAFMKRLCAPLSPFEPVWHVRPLYSRLFASPAAAINT